MSTDDRDYTRSVLSKAFWTWEISENFVERWESGIFDRNKYHGRSAAYFAGESIRPPPYWTTPEILLGVNTNQPLFARNAINLINSPGGGVIDELYFAPAYTFRIPCVINFDAYIPTLNLANYPNGTAIFFGFEVNSGGWIGDAVFWDIFTAGGLITNELKSVGVEDGVPTARGQALAGLITNAWRSFKLQITEEDLTLYQQTNAGSGFPMTELARLRLALDYNAAVIPFFANESSILQSGVRIGQFQVYSATRQKEVKRLINQASIAAGGFRESACLVFPKNACISIEQVYPVGTVAGVTVYVLCSDDYTCSTIDTEDVTNPFAQFSPTFAAGTTKHRTVQYTNLPKYGRVRVRNLDGVNAQGSCKVWIHKIP